MNDVIDVSILSIFGRGNWLATHLKSRGWKVELIDLSHQFTGFSPEDIEGPFGCLVAEDLEPSQLARYKGECDCEEVNGGLTLWLRDGPLEMRSATTEHRLSRLGIAPAVQERMKKGSCFELMAKGLAVRRENFAENWLMGALSQLTSGVLASPHEAAERDLLLPARCPWLVRWPDHKTGRRSLTEVEKTGVHVITGCSLSAVRSEGRNLNFVELDSGNKETLARPLARAHVMFLSGSELARVSPELIPAFLNEQPQAATWQWTRIRLGVQGSPALAWIPPWTLMIEDIYAPWTHAGFVVLKKSRLPDQLDAWVRLPQGEAVRVQALERTQKQICEQLGRRLPGAQVTVLPITSINESLWPVESEDRKSAWSGFKNMLTSNRENQVGLDPLSQMFAAQALLPKLEKMKANWDAEAAKAARRAAKRQPEVAP